MHLFKSLMLIPTSYLVLLTVSTPVSNKDSAIAGLTANTLVTSRDTVSLDKRALGAASVFNRCNFQVYLYVCGQNPAVCTSEITLAPHTGFYQETYSNVNNGRSLKVAPTSGEVQKPVLQLEYTNGADGRVSYDISEVDGNPFGPYGFSIASNNPSCAQGFCPPPATDCPTFFKSPTDGIPLFCPNSDGIALSVCA